MQPNSQIRAIAPEDLPALKIVISANELFPAEMLDEMTADYFQNESCKDIWLTYTQAKAVAIIYCAPERMTEGTWNLYLIAVHPDYQGQGIGTALIHHLEQILAEQEERLLLVETSSLDEFKSTQKFYQKRGYEQEAKIREFYQAGEDKIVFRKSLLDLKP